ncbi:MAG TPA: hypothetical protein VK066_05405 [Chloroflexota bacterium]|nr:hypothetical protein [Chloroflexota bacterium]
MTERSEQRLSTADMAAAAERQSGQPPPASPTGASAPAPGGTEAAALFSADETQRFRDRWDDVQTGFVDEPRHAVEQADELVAEVMKRLAEIFAGERSKLESQWSRGDNVSTEDLRQALRRYRSFFDRLLSYGGQAAEAPAGASGAAPPANRAAAQAPSAAAPHPAAEVSQGGATRNTETPPPSQQGTPSPPTPGTSEPPATDRWEEAMPRYRASWERQFGNQGERWEAVEPCYRYAWEMQHQPQYRDRPWPAAEPELRQDWERRHPDTPWDRVADKVRAAWESMAPTRTR